MDFSLQGNLSELDFSFIARQYGGSAEIYFEREDTRWEQVRCPYCFREFSPFFAEYRVPKQNTVSDMDRGDDEDNSFDDIFGGDSKPSQQASKGSYQPYNDEVLAGFWNLYGQPVKGKQQPVMCAPCKFNKDENGNAIAPQGYVPSWTFLVDKDGFPEGMQDPVGGAVSTTKICPFCHNNLPFEYGKHPVKFVAVIGITRSGKTVYLSSLLEQFDMLVGDKTGLTTLTNTEEIYSYINKNKIHKGEALPGATPTGNLIPPLPTIVKNTRTQQNYTLVFFDIAGENCVKSEQMNKFGGFIRNADGIVMIIDPHQFADTFELEYDDNDDRTTNFRPDYVVRTMYQSFLGSDNAYGTKCKIPLAVALSKSDLLRPYFYNNPHLGGDFIFDDIDYNAYVGYRFGTPGFEPGFAFDDGTEVSELISDILNPAKHKDNSNVSGRSFYSYVDTQFENKAYFAFSALNTNPENQTLEAPPMAVRIEEPINWLLYKMGVIPAMYRPVNGNTKQSSYDSGAVVKINGGLKGATVIPQPKEEKTSFFDKLFKKK